MKHFTASLTTKETSKNVRDFVRTHQGEFHSLLKNVLPYLIGIACLSLLIQYYQLSDMAPKFIEMQKEIAQTLQNNPENAEEIKKQAFNKGLMAGMKEGLSGKYFFLGLVLQILAGYVFAVIAISWHRLILLGPDQYKPMDILKPEKHEMEFVIVLTLISAIIPGIVGYVAMKQTLDMDPAAFIGFALLGLIFPYVTYKMSFYFPAKAVNASISFKDSFHLTFGYFWKFLWACVRANIRVIGVLIIYSFVAGMVAGFMKAFITPGMGQEEEFITQQMLQHLVNVPILLYFQPLLTVLTVSVLSNYYQYALQNKKLP